MIVSLGAIVLIGSAAEMVSWSLSLMSLYSTSSAWRPWHTVPFMRIADRISRLERQDIVSRGNIPQGSWLGEKIARTMMGWSTTNTSCLLKRLPFPWIHDTAHALENCSAITRKLRKSTHAMYKCFLTSPWWILRYSTFALAVNDLILWVGVGGNWCDHSDRTYM